MANAISEPTPDVQAPTRTADVNLSTWCAQTADAHRDFEQHEMAMYPSADHRDTAIVEWVIRVLGNPELDESRHVLALIAARHHDELNPTGTAEWLTNRVNELTTERDLANDLLDGTAKTLGLDLDNHHVHHEIPAKVAELTATVTRLTPPDLGDDVPLSHWAVCEGCIDFG